MSFCDFNENVEDAIDQGCAYDDEEAIKQDAPQLLWLSDIPLFQSIKAMKPGGHSYLTDEDNDSELQCTYQQSRVAYRDETFVKPEKKNDDDKKKGKEEVGDALQKEPDSEDDEYADTVVGDGVVRDEKGTPVPGILPDWYEKYSSFLSKKAPNVILGTLKEMFECDDRINFKVDDMRFQIRGGVWIQEKEMKFHVNIFRDGGEFLVEFQRQSACLLDFHALYRQSLAHLNTIEDFLFKKINARSTGTFNFTIKTDRVQAGTADAFACFPVAFDISKVEEYIKEMKAAIVECEKRFASQLVAVRNEALCDLMLAFSKMRNVVFPTPESVLSVLSVATLHLSTEKNGLNKEMGRCIAVICSNLCSVKDCEKRGDATEEEIKVMSFTRLLISELIVPILLTFWEKERSAKCLPRDSETNNQIIHLLCVLYRGGVSQYTNLTQEMLKTMVAKIEKRLAVTTSAPAYVRMKASLASTLDVLKAAVIGDAVNHGDTP